jgi:DedD protein
MAKATISDDELQLKKRARRRLVGAVALVLLIVVFLPMILDSEPKPLNQDIAITIPPIPKPESTPQNPTPAPAVPGAPAAPRVTGLPEGNAAVQPEPAPSVEAKPELPKSEPPRPEANTDARPVPKSVPKHEVKPAPPGHAAAGDESFVVQLGAFSNAANARTLQKKLQDNKFKAYTELVKNAGGDRTRVRVGPYASREAAEKARDRLKSMKLIIGEAAVVRRD